MDCTMREENKKMAKWIALLTRKIFKHKRNNHRRRNGSSGGGETAGALVLFALPTAAGPVLVADDATRVAAHGPVHVGGQ